MGSPAGRGSRQAGWMAFGWPSIWISTFLGDAATGAGMEISSIPLVYFAVTPAGSTPSGSTSARSKAP